MHFPTHESRWPRLKWTSFLLVIESNIWDSKDFTLGSSFWDMKDWSGTNVASLSCWISMIPTQENTTPRLRNQSSILSPKVRFIEGCFKLQVPWTLTLQPLVVHEQKKKWRGWDKGGGSNNSQIDMLFVTLFPLYTPHTYWCGPPVNDSYQQGARLELF
jgi:hypothetical protein